MNKSDHGVGAPSRRRTLMRPEGGPAPFRHLAHLPSFRDNPIVFFTTCTYQRCKILASSKCDKILREIWQRSADHDGWWAGNYILMPDHVHLFARPEIGARRMANWVQMWKSVSSRQRSLSIQRSGKRIISIDIFDPVKIMPRNDITLNKTQCGLGWSRQLSHGRIAGR